MTGGPPARLAGALRDLAAARRLARPRIVTAAFPFVPARLELAHFASTYLPADTLNRAIRFLGGRSALVGATDVHSIQVSRDGRTRDGAAALCDRADAVYRAQFAAWRIAYDAYLRTDAPAHLATTHRVLRRLEAAGHLIEGTRRQLRCRGCDARPPPRLTRPQAAPATAVAAHAPACPWCGSTAIEDEDAPHLFLALEPLRRRIAGRVAFAPGPGRWLADILARPLEPWCATRDNAVGLPMHRPMPGKSLYLWFESLVGYATLAEALAAQGFPTADAEFVHHFGKNIVFHHGVLWPAIAEAGLGLAAPIRAGVRGFAAGDTEWADGLEGDPALRLYALTKVPDDGSDFRLIETEFASFRRTIWRNKIGNLMQRLVLCEAGPAGAPALQSPGSAPAPVPEAWVRETLATATAIGRHADALAARGIAVAVLAHLRAAGRFAVESGLLWSNAPADRALAGLIRRQCLGLLEIAAPGAAAALGAENSDRWRDVPATAEALAAMVAGEPG